MKNQPNISGKIFRIIAILLCFLLIFEQSGFAQVAAQLDIASHLSAMRNALTVDKFRPLHLRYLQYDPSQNNFRLLIDKGTLKNPSNSDLENTSKDLLKYFFIGLSLPNDTFWVNLRPDSPDNIIDDKLAQTDIGRILLEADLELKKDTARATSPETPEGQQYWNKLYQKAEELFGSQNVTIPTLTRPWIVPDEIIIRETTDSAYIYKATLKVMLEQDYLKNDAVYNFKDDRLKQLNEYSSQLIRETIIPKLTKEVNTAKKYAPLRQVYYSLILSQWFKVKFAYQNTTYSRLIESRNITSFTAKTPFSKDTYFKAYQKSFKDGEYNFQTPVSTPFGQTIRSYFSGGFQVGVLAPAQLGTEVATLGGGRAVRMAAIEGVPQVDYNAGVSIQADAQGSPISVKTGSVNVQPSRNEDALRQDLRRRAEQVLGRQVTEAELNAIVEAHLIGEAEGHGYQRDADGTFGKITNPDGTPHSLAYTPQEIARKTRVLQQIGFTKDEREKLIRSGVAGNQLRESKLAAIVNGRINFPASLNIAQSSWISNLNIVSTGVFRFKVGKRIIDKESRFLFIGERDAEYGELTVYITKGLWDALALKDGQPNFRGLDILDKIVRYLGGEEINFSSEEISIYTQAARRVLLEATQVDGTKFQDITEDGKSTPVTLSWKDKIFIQHYLLPLDMFPNKSDSPVTNKEKEVEKSIKNKTKISDATAVEFLSKEAYMRLIDQVRTEISKELWLKRKIELFLGYALPLFEVAISHDKADLDLFKTLLDCADAVDKNLIYDEQLNLGLLLILEARGMLGTDIPILRLFSKEAPFRSELKKRLKIDSARKGRLLYDNGFFIDIKTNHLNPLLGKIYIISRKINSIEIWQRKDDVDRMSRVLILGKKATRINRDLADDRADLVSGEVVIYSDSLGRFGLNPKSAEKAVKMHELHHAIGPVCPIKPNSKSTREFFEAWEEQKAFLGSAHSISKDNFIKFLEAYLRIAGREDFLLNDAGEPHYIALIRVLNDIAKELGLSVRLEEADFRSLPEIKNILKDISYWHKVLDTANKDIKQAKQYLPESLRNESNEAAYKAINIIIKSLDDQLAVTMADYFKGPRLQVERAISSLTEFEYRRLIRKLYKEHTGDDIPVFERVLKEKAPSAAKPEVFSNLPTPDLSVEDATTNSVDLAQPEELRKKAEGILGRTISDGELGAIQKAHEAGQGHLLGNQNPDGTYEKLTNLDGTPHSLAYTPQEIAQKARILQSAGFTQSEREKLIKFGVVGNRKEDIKVRALLVPIGEWKKRFREKPRTIAEQYYLTPLILGQNRKVRLDRAEMERVSDKAEIIDQGSASQVFTDGESIGLTLGPCIGIIIHNTRTRKTYVGHSDGEILDYVHETIKQAAADPDMSNREEIEVIVGGANSSVIDSEFMGFSPEEELNELEENERNKQEVLTLLIQNGFGKIHQIFPGQLGTSLELDFDTSRNTAYIRIGIGESGENPEGMSVRDYIDNLNARLKPKNLVNAGVDPGNSAAADNAAEKAEMLTPPHVTGGIDGSTRPSGPLAIDSSASKTGGIDFRVLPIVTQAIGNLGVHTNRSSLNRLSSVNLNQEWQEIERMVNAGITPSAERIKEYMQASCAKGEADQDVDKVINCISDILRQEEERCCSTDATLRDILVVLEASRSSTELSQIFLGKTI